MKKYILGVAGKKILSFSPPTPPMSHLERERVNFFSNFCYLIRVEHEKYSEMCDWIIRFGQNLKKWD
jgi:hypothetical protein